MQRNLVISPTAASSSIEIIEIDLGSAMFAYNNVFIALLNYMQYKLAFIYLLIYFFYTKYILIAFKTYISYLFVITYIYIYILVMNT